MADINPSFSPRKADQIVEQTHKSLGGRLRLVANTQVKLWKALVFAMFIAGFAAALAWGLSEDYLRGEEQASTFSSSEAAVQKLPDLISRNIASSKPHYNIGEEIILNAEIVNVGIGNADDSVGLFCVRDVGYFSSSDCVQEGGVYFSHHSVPPLVSGQSFKMRSHSFTLSRFGEYQVMVCADAETRGDFGDVDESDEWNNCSKMNSYTFSVIGVGADLVASQPRLVTSGTSERYQANIKNIGTTDANSSSVGVASRFIVNLNNDAKDDYHVDAAPRPARIAPGESVTVLSQGTPPLPSGTHSVRFCVDSNGSVPELNEFNNCGSKAVLTISKSNKNTKL